MVRVRGLGPDDYDPVTGMPNKNPLTELIRPHVAAITADQKMGCPIAKQIVMLYQMHVDCPGDPGARALCEAALDEWQKKRGAGK